jgi:tetratricopeptide (TPR) repeat protein
MAAVLEAAVVDQVQFPVAAGMLAQQGKYEQAEQTYREVLGDRLRVLGPDHPDTLATRHEIARMLARQGQHERAKQEYQEVLATELRVLGPDHLPYAHHPRQSDKP